MYFESGLKDRDRIRRKTCTLIFDQIQSSFIFRPKTFIILCFLLKHITLS